MLLNLNLKVIFNYSVKPTNKRVDIINEAAYKFRYAVLNVGYYHGLGYHNNKSILKLPYRFI